MKNTTPRKAGRKLGVEAHDLGKRPRVLDTNYAQSSDVREDRGTIQSRLGKRRKALTVRPKKLS